MKPNQSCLNPTMNLIVLNYLEYYKIISHNFFRFFNKILICKCLKFKNSHLIYFLLKQLIFFCKFDVYNVLNMNTKLIFLKKKNEYKINLKF